MCSSTRGPASPPSLVTWPTSTTAMPRSLAIDTNRAALSRTWATEPAAEEISGVCTVWMESTTSTLGDTSSTEATMLGTTVSEAR